MFPNMHSPECQAWYAEQAHPLAHFPWQRASASEKEDLGTRGGLHHLLAV